MTAPIELLFRLAFKPGWDAYFQKFDRPIQQRILKKFEQMNQPLVSRGLHGSHFLVEEVGQYRIAFIQKESTKFIHFVGSHKQYEKWYKKQ